MTRETMGKCISKHTAHAMRAAAIRLARERAGQDADAALAYGCVDWFRYDVVSPPHAANTQLPPAAARRDAGRDDALSRHGAGR
jgi:hypothetical protein